MEHVDVAVIGSGGGLKIAMTAAAMGLKTVLLESGPLGGTCLNRGCIPSKILIQPADYMLRMQRAGAVNLRWNGQVAVDYAALAARLQAEIRQVGMQLEKRIGHTPNLTWLKDTAHFAGPKKILTDGHHLLEADRIFIATGSTPRVPALPGLAGVPYMTSTEALQLTELPERMIVLGAGYIACELGHAFGTFGTRMEYLVRSRFLRSEDGEVQRLFEQRFSERHTVHRGIPEEVSYDGKIFHVRFRYENGCTETLNGDALLVVAGVTPNTATLGLESAGIPVDENGCIQVNDFLETDVEGVYALGDCIGRYLFRHSVNLESDYLIRTVLKGEAREAVDYGPMPHGVFTDPEIAGAGATEEELKAQGTSYVTGRAFYRESNAGVARGLEDGFVKLLVQQHTGRLLGAHIIGEEACTLIQGILPVLYARGSVSDLLRTVYIHPALPELIRDAARDAAGQLT